ncbi:hypothetical protein KP005_07195 [Geomonas nitrogeniifigens]|uniref:Uncharacterized protein n=1 Tax=Geomonas diazotrophica TaxID=2843197 RepID=A0ABX8JNB9_9BACT|nr:hypothetical protein [Geomonas nitrogeniifigens]QWV99062.1 hypothetical protein KP005_07195 [Geomonas nitrogeniifigens]
MSMLYLWHPSVSADGTVVDFILTRGDSDQVGGGSERFVGALIGALDLGAEPLKWGIKPYRCNYYSEYWEEEGWQSRWDFVWRVTLHFRVQVAVEPIKLGYLGISDIDDYSPEVESYKFEPYSCLAVAVFDSENRAKDTARRLITDKELTAARKEVPAPDPVVQVVREQNGEFHVRASLGSGDETFFRGAYPDTVLTFLQASGGVIHAKA